MRYAIQHSISAAALACLILGPVQAADWPCFRGNNYGFADDKDVPAKVSKDNILWKVKLPGPGASSPITFGDKIFVTCYTGYGTKISKEGMAGGGGFGKTGPDTGGDQKKLRFVLQCRDRKNGDLVWQKEVKPKLPEKPFSGFLREHGYTSSTPATDGERIYCFFGKTGVVAFDMDGKELWQTSVGTGTHMWGSATSPILYKDLVIVNAAIESDSLIALDKKTGDEVWRAKGMGVSWGSPILVQSKDGQQEVVVSVPGKVAAYDPDNKGSERWHCEGLGKAGGKGGGFGMGNPYTISTPVARDGIVYVTGSGGGPVSGALAVKTGGKGDVSKSHVLWRLKKGTTTVSPVLSGEFLYWVAGRATAVDTAKGNTIYNKSLYEGFSEYVSAVATRERIYALTRFDGLFVLASGDTFQPVSHLEFPDDESIFNASPAISDGRLFFRSNENLYCLGKKEG